MPTPCLTARHGGSPRACAIGAAVLGLTACGGDPSLESGSPDTGLMYEAVRGQISAPGGTFESGSFGYGFIGVGLGDWTCVVEGTLVEQGPATPGCPGCEWSFDLSAPTATSASGDVCAQIGLDGADDTFWGSYFDYQWGFASTYDLPYGDGFVAVEDAVFVYTPSAGWYPLVYDYSVTERVVGNADSLEFVAPTFRGESYAYRYYYRY